MKLIILITWTLQSS